jgi:FkbM family methyltransferase
MTSISHPVVEPPVNNPGAPHVIDGARVCVFRNGGRDVRFAVADPTDLIQSHHLRGNFYEEDELELIRRYLPPGKVFCDIGSNVGNHAVYIGLFLNPEQIIPFEVNPNAIALLRANLALNGLTDRADLSHLGLGLSDRSATDQGLSVPAGNMGAARIVDRGGRITLARGDDLLAGQRVDFLKIDVEGMELAVLAGLEATIRRHKPRLFVEVLDTQAEAFQDWAARSGYLVRARYRRYRNNENFLLVANDDAQDHRLQAGGRRRDAFLTPAANPAITPVYPAPGGARS